MEKNILPCPVIVLAGPTASGKTAIAIELAKSIDAEVVSADSVQVYQGLDIGSAKPSQQEMQGITHHMISVVSPKNPFSVKDYRQMAMQVLQDIGQRGKTAILCGGTGLYIKSILKCQSYADTPPNISLRTELNLLAKTHGNSALHDKLAQLDPKAAEQIHANNLPRVIRAIEVAMAGNHTSQDQEEELKVPFYAIRWPRETLWQRVEVRCAAMMQNGLVNEVVTLLRDGVDTESQAMRALGYRQIVDWIRGQTDCNDAKYAINMDATTSKTLQEAITIATRQYAKRQMTWFAHQHQGIQWIDMPGKTTRIVADEILKNISKGLEQA